jgi:hypothetical protein
MNGDDMLSEESHLSDQDLVLLLDGELPPSEKSHAASHLNGCWTCRARKQELEAAIADFVRFHRSHLDPLLPSASGPRALLKARISQAASNSKPGWRPHLSDVVRRQAGVGLALAAAVVLVLAGAYAFRHQVRSVAPHAAHNVPVSFPEPSLTPGAVTAATREQVCSATASKNRAVSVALRRRVFDEYGISSSEPEAYEVDYLITPALGGADDIRNLWPQSYRAAVWNARVKDALEDRLRDMVCGGKLDLASAQNEISADWIAAYKKYFHTDRPLDTP